MPNNTFIQFLRPYEFQSKSVLGWLFVTSFQQVYRRHIFSGHVHRVAQSEVAPCKAESVESSLAAKQKHSSGDHYQVASICHS